MRSFGYLIALLLCCLTTTQAQKLATLNGKILDASSKDPIDYATAFIPQSAFYADADSSGNFSLRVPADSPFILRISRLGFISATWQIKAIPENNSIFKQFELSEDNVAQEVIIQDKREVQGGMVKEKVELFQLMPTVSGNIESVLPHIALGVQAGTGGELTSQYNVRGGNYDENLVYVNDFEIFRPQLVRSGQQEGLSFANANLTKELHFSSGGFEAKYGDKLSSVLDISYKTPNAFASSIELSLLGANAHLEGKTKIVNRTFRYLVGARYKTTKYILGSLDIEGEYQPNFTDLQMCLTYDIKSNLQLAVLSNYNKSSYFYIPKSGETGAGGFDFLLKLYTVFEGAEKDIFENGMGGLSLTYLSKRKTNPYYVKMLSYLQASDEAEQFDILGYYSLYQVETGSKDQEGKKVQLWGEGTQHQYARNYLFSTIQTNEIRGAFDLMSSNKTKSHFLQWGLRNRNLIFDDRLHEWERQDSAGYSLPHNGSQVVLNYVLNSKQNIHNTQYVAWLQDSYTWQVSSDWRGDFTVGVRSHYNKLNEEVNINPRLRLEFLKRHPEDRKSFWLTAGLYSQPPLYREMRRPNGSINYNIKAQQAYSASIGLNQDVHWNKISRTPFRWISEIYYKQLNDVVIYDVDNVRITYSGENNGTGYAVGWDNRISGEFVPGAESWVNLSLLRTREKINDVQHIVRTIGDSLATDVNDVPRPTDQFFSLNVFFQDYLPSNENFKMHLNLGVASGLPFGVRGNNEIARNTYRYTPYHRVDLGFSVLLFDKKKLEKHPRHPLRFSKSCWLSLEVFNLLKVSNAASKTWIKSLYNVQFAIPNNLTSRRINLRVKFDF